MRQKILSFYLITVPPECGTFMCLLNNYWKQLSKAMPNFLKSFQPPNITFSTATRSDLYKVLIRLYTFLCVLNPCFFPLCPKHNPHSQVLNDLTTAISCHTIFFAYYVPVTQVFF